MPILLFELVVKAVGTVCAPKLPDKLDPESFLRVGQRLVRLSRYASGRSLRKTLGYQISSLGIRLRRDRSRMPFPVSSREVIAAPKRRR